MSWHQTQAVFFFSWISLPCSHLLHADEVMLWATLDCKSEEGWRGHVVSLPIPPLSFYHFLSFPLYVSDEAPPVLGHSPRHSLQRLGINPPSAALNTKQASLLPSFRVCARGFSTWNHGVRLPSSGDLSDLQLIFLFFGRNKYQRRGV